MPRTMKLFACLAGLLCTAATYAQTAAPASTSSPVARVYVSRPTHVDAFNASSSGKLTPVPGSPFSGISLYHLSVTAKFLFGGGDDHKHIFTYSIASNGALKKVASVDGTKYDVNCCRGPQRLDLTGSTLYNYVADGGGLTLETFRIESNGDLQFIGNTVNPEGSGSNADTPGMISFLGNNRFAYQAACDTDVQQNPDSAGYKRESNGFLQGINMTFEMPEAKPGDVYCPFDLATDPSNHLAVAVQAWNLDTGESDGDEVLASYTADSHGNLSTKSTWKTMPRLTVGVNEDSVMSISPTGKLLAVNDFTNGFVVYHFNGANPITKYTGVLHSSERFLQFGWDKENHLYALSTNKLHVYSATSTSIKEEPRSPYSIPEASSVIVKSLN